MKIDLLSPASFDGGQPHRQYEWLREHQPVAWHDEPGGKGFWAVTRHADVWAVDRDFQTLASVSPRRYFCTQCHVPQTDAEPPIENGFVDIDTLLDRQRQQRTP